jgi:hypothetical protein
VEFECDVGGEVTNLSQGGHEGDHQQVTINATHHQLTRSRQNPHNEGEMMVRRMLGENN